MSSASVAIRVRELLAPVVADAGYDLEDVTVSPAGRRRMIRVVVDADSGVSLDAVAEVSRRVSAVLDDADVIPGAYLLEVSSPGVDRPLTAPRHWRRARGRLVDVQLPEGGALTGRLVDADDTAAVLAVDGGQRRLPYAEVARARVQVEFRRADPPQEGP